MCKLMLLICVLIYSSMVCQAQNASLTNKCVIEYNVNEIENKSILVPDACNILSDIIKSKIEDIYFRVEFYINPANVYVNFPDETNKSVSSLTYEATIKNEGNPALDNVTLEAKLCDGLVYASSKYKGNNNVFYKQAAIQNHKDHNTSEIKWNIGTLQPGEERTISINAIYLDDELPKTDKTEFKMNAQLWGYEILRKNDHIAEINPP